MKLIIAGSRFIHPPIITIEHIKDLFGIQGVTEIISGGASGVDKAGEAFADRFNYKKMIFKANWDKYKRAAGPIRNEEMALYSDCLLLIWDGSSNGSKNMKENMLKLKKPIYEIIIKDYNLSKYDF